MNQQQQIERDRINKRIAEAAGWTDVHGGTEDGGAYLRGWPPGMAGRGLMMPVPDLLALVNGHCPPAKTCKWKEWSFGTGVFETGCNQEHTFLDDGGPIDNHFAYCPFCGGEIEVATPPLTAEEIEMEKGDRAHQEMKDREAEAEHDIERGPW